MYIDRDGVRLYYEIHGQGEPPLLFVHGWMMSAEVWQAQVAGFSRCHQIVRLDLRGFGRSDKPKVEYTFELFADDVDCLIQSLGLNAPIFIGWSKGASIGLVYAVTHPGRLSKLVLVDGSPRLLSGKDYEQGLAPDDFQRAINELRTDFKVGARGFIDMMFPEPGVEDLKAWTFDITQQTTPEVALNSIINDARYDLRPLLQEIILPTLICYGDQDVICPPGASKVMHTGLARSEIHAFSGKGHAPFLTAPDSFNTRLSAFLSS